MCIYTNILYLLIILPVCFVVVTNSAHNQHKRIQSPNGKYEKNLIQKYMALSTKQNKQKDAVINLLKIKIDGLKNDLKNQQKLNEHKIYQQETKFNNTLTNLTIEIDNMRQLNDNLKAGNSQKYNLNNLLTIENVNFIKLKNDLSICKNNEQLNSINFKTKINDQVNELNNLRLKLTNQTKDFNVCLDNENKQKKNLNICQNNENDSKTLKIQNAVLQKQFDSCRKDMETASRIKDERFIVQERLLQSKIEDLSFTNANNRQLATELKTKINAQEIELNYLNSKLSNQSIELNVCLEDKQSNLTTLQSKYAELQNSYNLCKTNLSIPLTKPQPSADRSMLDSVNNEPKCSPFGQPMGFHLVSLPSRKTFKAPCILENVWTVIERRLSRNLSFNRDWQEYRQGFGQIEQEFFIGLEKLYLMTSSQPHELLIRLTKETEILYARYSRFKIGSEAEGYPIIVLGAYSGNAGDGLRESEMQQFSTYDRDNDQVEGVNCAADANGGWWLTKCGTTNLNFQYKRKLVPWNNLLDDVDSIEILLRPAEVFENSH